MINTSYRLAGAINPRGQGPAICVPVFSTPSNNSTYSQYIGIRHVVVQFEQVDPNEWEHIQGSFRSRNVEVGSPAVYWIAWSDDLKDSVVDTIDVARVSLLKNRWIIDLLANPFERLDFAQICNEYSWFSKEAEECERSFSNEGEAKSWLGDVLMLSRIRFAVDSMLVSRSAKLSIRRRVSSRLTIEEPGSVISSIKRLFDSHEVVQVCDEDISLMELFFSEDVAYKYAANRLFASDSSVEVYPTKPARWFKKITASDAQRKLSGNQRGSITLTKAGFPIDFQTYFRNDFFSSADWFSGKTRTGKSLETASITMKTYVFGKGLGNLNYNVTYAPNRQANQDNYTSLLHLGPLSSIFESRDMSGSWLFLERDSRSQIYLTITTAKP